MDPKPARRYIAKAVPTRPPGQFYAQFAFPGVPPKYVDRQGVPTLFSSSDEATRAALEALVDALNNRPGMPDAHRRQGHGRIEDRRTPEAYTRLSGAQASILMAEANLTPTFVSYLLAAAPDRLLQWMDANGNDDKAKAPHWFRVILEIFKAHPEAIDTAEAVTESVTAIRPQVADFRERGAHFTRLLREVEPHLETADQGARFKKVAENHDNLTFRERTKILEALADELAIGGRR